MQQTKIHLNHNLMEMMVHGTPDFQFQHYDEDVFAFEDGCIDLHWHYEFELGYVVAGEMQCTVGNHSFVVKQGEGIFINAGMLHRFDAAEPCFFPNFLFRPALLGTERSLVFQQYIQPFLNSDISHLILQTDVPWQGQLLRHFESVSRIARAKDFGWELQIKAELLLSWQILASHPNDFVTIEYTGISKRMLLRIQKMTAFIAANYQTIMTLEQIASSAHISKSEAMRCFRTVLQTSPMGYLQQVRLQAASQFLRTTQKSVGAIAEQCGFESANYFARQFRVAYGLPPTAWRKNQK